MFKPIYSKTFPILCSTKVQLLFLDHNDLKVRPKLDIFEVNQNTFTFSNLKQRFSQNTPK